VARLLEVSVTGLVGRESIYRQSFNRHVNILFGLNGSGKTSLLRIIHSAMVGDADLLRGIVFDRAEIKIQPLSTNAIVTRTLVRPNAKELAAKFPKYSEDFAQHGISEADFRAFRERELRQGKLHWTTKPEKEGSKRWSHRYLPTTRLYLEPDGSSRNLARSMYPTDLPSEDQIETRFATLIEGLWTRYSSTMLKAVGEAQADGLANIFKAILSDQPGSVDSSDIEAQTAYKRLQAFLQRQGSPKLLGPFDAFVTRYQKNAQLRRVVEDINVVEERIENATARRDTLQSLIERMFSGKKRVTFADTSIQITSDLRIPITLASLSTGEKHLLRILVEVLLAGEDTIIIDEPELSMHIDWQRELVSAMRSVNPEAQLIMATHSPEVMADVPDEEIFRI